MQDDTLADLAVLVTGGSGGIGRAIVRAVAQAGGRPVIHCGRDVAAAQALLEEIGGQGWVVQADLSVPDGAAALWARAEALAGRVYGLVNNAGTRTQAVLDGDRAAWQAAWARELRVNLQAPADLCRDAVLHMQARGGGRIVNIASRAAQRGYVADFMPYGASKAALINLTKSLARNYGSDGIVAVTVSPGLVDAGMAAGFIAEQGLAAATGDIPVGRMADPAALGALVAFVLRPDQGSLNGATLDVNGGSYIR